VDVRALRVLGLVVVVALTGLLSGGAAGAEQTTAAVMAAAAEAGPAAPVSAPPVSAPVTAAAPAVSDARSPVVPYLVAGTPCKSNARACVDLSANRAWLISGGAVQYGPVPVLHGRKGFRTQPGTFRVSFKNRHHVSSIYHTKMPYSVFFNGGIAFHQGPLNGGGSHGCVRLSRDAARTFFGFLHPGDVVQVVR
jgi:hypothetical protein